MTLKNRMGTRVKTYHNVKWKSIITLKHSTKTELKR